jgi:NAD(P)-dependent dehydrogenase (short-subunit alcohol dehydrogenase family)
VETATALLAAGAPDAVALAPHLTAPDAVTAAFTELGERWGALNALANAAAPATQRARWYEIPDEEWYASFTVATMGPVRTRRAALALLRAAGSGAGSTHGYDVARLRA